LDGFEARAHAKGFRMVAGVDEAGRGPLAGPVVAAAVILPPGFCPEGIRDSKALSPAARNRAHSRIAAEAVSFAVALSTPEEIDEINILQASLLAMRRAVEQLSQPPDFLYVDGTFPVPCAVSQETLVAGDSRCLSVMAASILAKVARDEMMEQYDRVHPGYRFSSHKGYPTRDHLAALRLLGPCPIHRKTFRGVRVDGA
jgi:ribonuclease HII